MARKSAIGRVRPAWLVSTLRTGRPAHRRAARTSWPGIRERQLCGPLEADSPPAVTILVLRRYRCVACSAVITVAPQGVARRRHYGHAAIAMALALWALFGETSAAVRSRVCAFRITLCSTDWPTLRRWARAAGAGPLREVAARAAQRAVGHAPPSLRKAPVWAQAFAGGSAMR